MTRGTPLRALAAALALLAAPPACFPSYDGASDGDEDDGTSDDDGGAHDDGGTDDDAADDDAAVDDGADDDAADDDAAHDGDADGVSAEEGDCDDGDPARYPYAWEDPGDGVDNDCDGAADFLDTDVPEPVELDDDQYAHLEFRAFTFPFCGQEWTEAAMVSNGRLMFSGATSAYTESENDFVNIPGFQSIAPLWDDLLTGDGSFAWTEFDGAAAFYWLGVSQRFTDGTVDSSTLTVVLLADGRFRLHYGGVDARDGLVGWSCSPGGLVPAEADLSGWVEARPEGSVGIGRGTEAFLYELFEEDGRDAFDLAHRGLTFCVGSGDDADGDGWTDLCGDCDDADPGRFPGSGC